MIHSIGNRNDVNWFEMIQPSLQIRTNSSGYYAFKVVGKQIPLAPSSSWQRMINDCQQRASLYIVVLIWRKRRAVILLQSLMGEIYVHWNGSLHSLMCISLQPHCVCAVNQKTVSSQCDSGRLLIAFRRIYCLTLCFSFHSVAFVFAYCLFCCLYLFNVYECSRLQPFVFVLEYCVDIISDVYKYVSNCSFYS